MIEYTSTNGYTGQLYGKSSFRIVDPYGKEVFHTGFRAFDDEEELKRQVDEFPEFHARLFKKLEKIEADEDT